MTEPEKNKIHDDALKPTVPQEECGKNENRTDSSTQTSQESELAEKGTGGESTQAAAPEKTLENSTNDGAKAAKCADGEDSEQPNQNEENDADENANASRSKPVYDVRGEMPGTTKNSSEDVSQPGLVRVLLILALIGLLAWWFMGDSTKSAQISYGFFIQQLEEGNLEKVTINANKVSGEFKVPPLDPESTSSKPENTPSDAKKVSEDATQAPSVSQENAPKDEDAETDQNTESVQNAETVQNAESTQNEEIVQNAETAQSTESTQNEEVVQNAETDQNTEGAQNKEAAQNNNTQATESVTVKENEQTEDSGEAGKKYLFGLSEAKKPARLPRKFTTLLPSPLEAGGTLDAKIREKLGKDYCVKESLDAVGYMMLISIIVTVVLVGSIWMQFRRTRDQLGGGQMFGFSKSPAKRFQGGEDSINFSDVAGLKSVKEDLSEIVDFLKNPKKFERLGARIPKGVLMCGPPGTGKTLLARAIAGEAGVAFYSINASEFIQMFVGVGASRVRDMFDVARSNAPAILFIDEIDAIGRLRGTGIGGGNDEREQTLNQILSEMDGFATTDVVIVIAATNRPDVLDPALLRPGRFDRHVTVDRPVQKDRIQLFRVHTKKVPLNNDVVFERLASMTTGLTGADIRNIVNEAALWACRFNRKNVSMSDFYYAIDKVLMGAKREEVISNEEKEKTSYHEAGHTLVAWLTPECDRVSKVSVIPRGRALGVTWSVPEEDRLMHSQREIHAKLKMMLGGREAERLVFNELNAGAANDLERATEIVQKMVASWGMSPRIGPAAFRTGDEHPFLGKEMSTQRNFSDKTAQIIDEEIMRILNDASQQVEALLSEHRNMLDALAQALVIREELDEAQIEEILGPPAYRRKLE